jgi:putative transposase
VVNHPGREAVVGILGPGDFFGEGECIRPGTPRSLEDARRLVEGYVQHYNNVRLNSGIGYITPKDMLAGHQQEIQAERDRKLEAARKQRQIRRQQAA